ncbi:alpha/beta fold hydrolase [Legionella shakespearei]|uniref:Lipolytic enzyme n=1 Tax=Legionella shakespearei DSM 23087 TaxID=1122169 RepID=A0A0W0Z6Y0_9GAMM|nr:alpha/beta hydrolase [Legionella shakespearei]KTD64611.1 lipolytic enzyme [Legionella shakespearei DSM 23087]
MKNKMIVFIVVLMSSFILFTPTLAATIEANEHMDISYTDSGKGTPLILIHAFPTDKDLWMPQREELKKHFRVITLDLWGFGLSAPVDGQAVTMSDYADEVNQLLERLNINKAIVGGESMGGYVTLAFLEKYPNKVEGLILSDTQSIPDTDEAKTKRESSALDVLDNGTAKFIEGFLPKALSPSSSEDTRNFLRTLLEKQPAQAYASALRGMALRSDTSQLLANSSLPILIISGEEDMVINKQQSLNMHALAKNSSLVLIKDAGHLSSLEQPEEWNKAVIARFTSS